MIGIRKSVDPALVSDWFALMEAWEEAEADLRRATDPAHPATEESKRAAEAAELRLQALKQEIDAAIAAARAGRPKELGEDLVVGAVTVVPPDALPAPDDGASEPAAPSNPTVRLPRR